MSFETNEIIAVIVDTTMLLSLSIMLLSIARFFYIITKDFKGFNHDTNGQI